MSQSEELIEREKKLQEARDEEAAEKTRSAERIFWHIASKGQIANWIPERIADSGKIIQWEGSLRFNEHICVTDDPKKIKFILASTSFQNSTVVECASMEEANALTAKQARMKGTRTGVCENVSTERIDVTNMQNENIG